MPVRLVHKSLIALVLVVAAAAAVGISWRTRVAAAERLPALPDLTGRPRALVSHLVDADRAARRSPRHGDVVGALAVAYHADLFYEQASSAYALAAALDPGNWHWPYYRALVYLERGNAGEARAALEAVVTARPDLGLAWWRLGDAAFKQARFDEADAAYARAEHSPRATDDRPDVQAYARVGRARVALNRGDAAAAARILETVIQSEPRFGAAYRVLAEALRAGGRAAEAERASARAAALRAYTAPADSLVNQLADVSQSSVFLLRQAATTDLSGDPARRERLTRRALEADPDNPDVVYEMGALLQQLRRPADALPYFTRHLDLVEDDLQTLVQIGKCYSDLGRLEDAETTLRRALSAGEDAVGFYNLGVVLERRDRLQDAEASYSRAIALGPGLASARSNLGALLARSGRTAEAMAHLTEAIRLDPSSPDAYTNVSALLLERGAIADAARYARLAIEADPRHADAHVNLAVALARVGDLDEARRHLDEALRIDPRHPGARANRQALDAARR